MISKAPNLFSGIFQGICQKKISWEWDAFMRGEKILRSIIYLFRHFLQCCKNAKSNCIWIFRFYSVLWRWPILTSPWSPSSRSSLSASPSPRSCPRSWPPWSSFATDSCPRSLTTSSASGYKRDFLDSLLISLLMFQTVLPRLVFSFNLTPFCCHHSKLSDKCSWSKNMYTGYVEETCRQIWPFDELKLLLYPQNGIFSCFLFFRSLVAILRSAGDYKKINQTEDEHYIISKALQVD